jgi:hypothetical protein
VKNSELYDRTLKMYKTNEPLESQPMEIGRLRAFTPGWLENESIFLHMEYKYLLEILKAGLYEEFFEDFRNILVAFQDPARYGRSPMENSSFIVSSAHPDKSLHGAGFVARLSGVAAEFLSIWRIMMAGKNPFYVQDGGLRLSLKPVLPGWLFTETGTLTFTFLGHTTVTYHNPERLDTYLPGIGSYQVVLYLEDDQQVTLENGVVSAPYAEMVRNGQVSSMDIYLKENL